MGNFLLCCDAIWVEECRSYLSASHDDTLSWHDSQRHGGVCGRYFDEIPHSCGAHHALYRVLERSRRCKLRINPKKCIFRVGSWKLLGFIVNKRRIKIDPVKVKAIVDMPPPKDLKQLRGFLGQLQFVWRFISQHSEKFLPFTKLLKKDYIFGAIRVRKCSMKSSTISSTLVSYGL